ncbi:MAG: aminopeptidase, partial [Sphaerochaetaceae bacterium]
DCYGYRGFDENTTSTFLLGMGEASHIEALSEYADEQELMEKTGCNVSTVRIRIPFGTPNLQITAQSQDGFVQLLMQSGAFIE